MVKSQERQSFRRHHDPDIRSQNDQNSFRIKNYHPDVSRDPIESFRVNPGALRDPLDTFRVKNYHHDALRNPMDAFQDMSERYVTAGPRNKQEHPYDVPKEETYSTAGTFPMPEAKEKEPLLAELEIVGRVPLVQLDSGPGVTRSRSWYLCCPVAPEEDVSRESSWRYSSLRPVTAPPVPSHQNAFNLGLAEGADAETALRGERDGLRRALAAERARAAAAARAHDARLAELHGVIAELVRRRTAGERARAIPEEESERDSDACESTTQPAGDLDNDADQSRTDQNDSSSLLSPAELPMPHDIPNKDPKTQTENSDFIGRSDSLRTQTDADDETTDNVDLGLDSGQGVDIGKALEHSEKDLEITRILEAANLRASSRNEKSAEDVQGYETSLNLSEKDWCGRTNSCRHSKSDRLKGCECCRVTRSSAKESECCQSVVKSSSDFIKTSDCCQYDRKSSECCARVSPYVHSSSPGRGEAQPRVASRVRLRRTEDSPHVTGRELAADQGWSAQLVEHLAGEMCAHGELGEAAASAAGEAAAAALAAGAARCERLAADARLLEGALAEAKDTAERVWLACTLHESWSVCLCGALRSADRALETYDVLLALAEARRGTDERASAELVARRLLARLELDAGGARPLGEPLLSPGPWLDCAVTTPPEGEWSAACEARLRRHAARLKSETARVRAERPPAPLHSYTDLAESESGALRLSSSSLGRHHDMETAVLMQEVVSCREERAVALAALGAERARSAALARALAAATGGAGQPHQPLHPAAQFPSLESVRVHSAARRKARRQPRGPPAAPAAAETNL